MLDLDKVKRHLRINDDLEDDYLVDLIDTANEYVTAITGVANDVNAPKRYDMACLLLIAHWYSNRESTSDTSVNKVPHGFEMLVTSIKAGRLHV